VGNTGYFPGKLVAGVNIIFIDKEKGEGHYAHQGSVAILKFLKATAYQRGSACGATLQGAAGGMADVKNLIMRAPVAFLRPANECIRHMLEIITRYKTFGRAESKGGII